MRFYRGFGMVAEVYQQADLETRGPQIVVNLGLVYDAPELSWTLRTDLY